MSRALLAEEIKRLLPGENNKRIRQAIMLAYGGAAGVARGVRDQIDQDNRQQDGILINGQIDITSTTSATLSDWAWVIDFAIQQSGSQTIPILAPDDDFVRLDFFHGDALGEIHYTPGGLDPLGNAIFPNIPEDHIILVRVARNPDGSNGTPEIPVQQWQDAPYDGKLYGRQNQEWQKAVEEAPADGKEYARKNAGWVEVTGGGSPSTGALEDLDTFPVLKFDKNYRYSHQMIGPITISVSDLVINQTGNYNVIYIQADGTNKPLFEDTDFALIYDGWNNTVGKWNRLRFEYTPEGKAIVQIFDTAGDTNPGSGATTFNLKFDDDYNFQHVISGTVHLTVDTTGAEYAKKTIFYFRANGTDKPTWAAPIEANWDNYINEEGVWNRFYLEYTPENKVTLQIINT